MAEDTTTEYNLRLPNGTLRWDDWQDTLSTAETEQTRVRQALEKDGASAGQTITVVSRSVTTTYGDEAVHGIVETS